MKFKVCFQQRHKQGLHPLFLTVPWDPNIWLLAASLEHVRGLKSAFSIAQTARAQRGQIDFRYFHVITLP